MTMQRYMKIGKKQNKNAFFFTFGKDFLEKICWNQKKCVPLHPQMRNRLLFIVGAIAQLVEQRTENPCVPGSIPGGTTLLLKLNLRNKIQLFFVNFLIYDNVFV